MRPVETRVMCSDMLIGEMIAELGFVSGNNKR